MSAAAVTRNVATNGTDSVTCGSTASPCRSISRAIQNAVAGDRVVVRPGIYSDDLDADGVFGEPGEEPGAINVGVASLSVESTGGAAATLIRRRGGTPSNGVVISGAGVKFGKLNKGFTIVTQGGVNSTVISLAGSRGWRSSAT
jgi:hypothetical protein